VLIGGKFLAPKFNEKFVQPKLVEKFGEDSKVVQHSDAALAFAGSSILNLGCLAFSKDTSLATTGYFIISNFAKLALIEAIDHDYLSIPTTELSDNSISVTTEVTFS
jgi:hypothetical protein